MYIPLCNHIRLDCTACQQCETSSKESMKPLETFPPATKIYIHMYICVCLYNNNNNNNDNINVFPNKLKFCAGLYLIISVFAQQLSHTYHTYTCTTSNVHQLNQAELGFDLLVVPQRHFLMANKDIKNGTS